MCHPFAAAIAPGGVALIKSERPRTTPSSSLCASPDLEREIRELLAETYLPEGVDLWIAHATKQGWSYETCLSRALGYIEGNFA